jgi:hypothetical protein
MGFRSPTEARHQGYSLQRERWRPIGHKASARRSSPISSGGQGGQHLRLIVDKEQDRVVQDLWSGQGRVRCVCHADRRIAAIAPSMEAAGQRTDPFDATASQGTAKRPQPVTVRTWQPAGVCGCWPIGCRSATIARPWSPVPTRPGSEILGRHPPGTIHVYCLKLLATIFE